LHPKPCTLDQVVSPTTSVVLGADGPALAEDLTSYLLMHDLYMHLENAIRSIVCNTPLSHLLRNIVADLSHYFAAYGRKILSSSPAPRINHLSVTVACHGVTNVLVRY